jgi:hypothetical protein
MIDPSLAASHFALQIFKPAMSHGEVGEPNLSRSQRTSTAKRVVTFAILMAIL